MASGDRYEVERRKQRHSCGTLSNSERDTAPIFLNEEQFQAVNHIMNGEDGPAAYQQENNEQLDYSMVDTSQESQQTFQREFEGQVNGLANAVAVGAPPATDTSNGVEEMDWAETSIIAREEWQQLQQLRDDGGCIASNHYVRNGEAIEECHSIEEEALVADLNVERPVQSPYPRGLGAPIYWSRSPTQESGCHRPQRMQSAAPAVSRPDEDQGLVQCHQMCNNVLVNAVSSMGPTLQAIQHTLNLFTRPFKENRSAPKRRKSHARGEG